MYVVGSTRFNRNTWIENKRWRDMNEYKGCIYGTPNEISAKIILESTVFVIEMHNDENKIKGIGMIKNVMNVKKYYNIYSNKNYNRYTYKSEYRVDIDEMSWKELAYMHILEGYIFKTSGHLKRGYGITCIPKVLININVLNIEINIINVLKNIFSLRFPKLDIK